MDSLHGYSGERTRMLPRNSCDVGRSTSFHARRMRRAGGHFAGAIALRLSAVAKMKPIPLSQGKQRSVGRFLLLDQVAQCFDDPVGDRCGRFFVEALPGQRFLAFVGLLAMIP